MSLFLFSAVVGYVLMMSTLKLLYVKRVNIVVAVFVNYIVGALLSYAATDGTLTVTQIVNASWFPFGVLMGIMFMTSFVLYAYGTNISGVAVVTVTTRASVALTVGFAFLALGEEVTLVKLTMLLLSIIAVMFVAYKKEEDKRKLDIRVLFTLFAIFLFAGANDIVSQEVVKRRVDTPLDADFLRIVIFASGAAASIFYYLITCKKGIKRVIKWSDVLWGVLLGVTNWVCLYSLLEALAVMESSVFFPVYQALVIICITLVGVLFFRERLTKINYIGIALAMIAVAGLSLV